MIQPQNMPRNTKENIELRVARKGPTECWEWQGSQTPDGYGQVWYLGKHWQTHRLFWTWANGAIPEGLLVCHSCDNPLCCNVAHLWLGTHSDNERDKWSKGRGTSMPPIHKGPRPDWNYRTGESWYEVHPNVQRRKGSI